MAVMKWVTSGESMVLVRERVMAADMPSVARTLVHHDAGTSGQHSYRGASAKLIILVCLFYPVESRPTPIHSLRFLAAGGPRLRRDALDLAADGLGELGRCSLHAKGAFFEEPIWNLCETQPVTVVHRRRGREIVLAALHAIEQAQ